MILLDTHAVVWLASGQDKLGDAAFKGQSHPEISRHTRCMVKANVRPLEVLSPSSPAIGRFPL